MPRKFRVKDHPVAPDGRWGVRFSGDHFTRSKIGQTVEEVPDIPANPDLFNGRPSVRVRTAGTTGSGATFPLDILEAVDAFTPGQAVYATQDVTSVIGDEYPKGTKFIVSDPVRADGDRTAVHPADNPSRWRAIHTAYLDTIKPGTVERFPVGTKVTVKNNDHTPRHYLEVGSVATIVDPMTTTHPTSYRVEGRRSATGETLRQWVHPDSLDEYTAPKAEPEYGFTAGQEVVALRYNESEFGTPFSRGDKGTVRRAVGAPSLYGGHVSTFHGKPGLVLDSGLIVDPDDWGPAPVIPFAKGVKVRTVRDTRSLTKGDVPAGVQFESLGRVAVRHINDLDRVVVNNPRTARYPGLYSLPLADLEAVPEHTYQVGDKVEMIREDYQGKVTHGYKKGQVVTLHAEPDPDYFTGLYTGSQPYHEAWDCKSADGLRQHIHPDDFKPYNPAFVVGQVWNWGAIGMDARLTKVTDTEVSYIYVEPTSSGKEYTTDRARFAKYTHRLVSEAPEPEEFHEGQKVRIVANKHAHAFPVGKVITLGRRTKPQDIDGHAAFLAVDKNTYGWEPYVRADEFVAYEAEPETLTLPTTVGSIIRVKLLGFEGTTLHNRLHVLRKDGLWVMFREDGKDAEGRSLGTWDGAGFDKHARANGGNMYDIKVILDAGAV